MLSQRLIHLLLLVSICRCVTAAPVVAEDESTYAISGANAAALRSDMHRLGPYHDGKSYSAYTYYYVKWHYEHTSKNDGCVITSQQVTVDTNSTYPHWLNYAAASPAMQQRWNTFLDNLKIHERVHIEHGRLAANEIDTMLAALTAMQNCNILENVINQQADNILEKYKEEDMEYDRVTNHGITQGATLSD
jgi:predicted secreted Zn-dependent protease